MSVTGWLIGTTGRQLMLLLQTNTAPMDQPHLLMVRGCLLSPNIGCDPVDLYWATVILCQHDTTLVHVSMEISFVGLILNGSTAADLAYTILTVNFP